MLRKSFRFWRAVYSCFSSCSRRPSCDDVSALRMTAHRNSTNSVVFYVRVLDKLRGDLRTVEVVLTDDVTKVHAAFLRPVELVQALCNSHMNVQIWKPKANTAHTLLNLHTKVVAAGRL
jgi:hypothetical protein